MINMLKKINVLKKTAKWLSDRIVGRTGTPTMLVLHPLEIGDSPERDTHGRIDPFRYDPYHTGVTIARNVMLLKDNHDNENADYIHLVNLKTGERVRIAFPKEWQ